MGRRLVVLITAGILFMVLVLYIVDGMRVFFGWVDKFVDGGP
jgi:hypothetical protein